MYVGIEELREGPNSMMIWTRAVLACRRRGRHLADPLFSAIGNSLLVVKPTGNCSVHSEGQIGVWDARLGGRTANPRSAVC